MATARRFDETFSRVIRMFSRESREKEGVTQFGHEYVTSVTSRPIRATIALQICI